MDFDFSTGVERRRFGPETYDLPPVAQGSRLQFQVPAASGSSNATSSSSSSSSFVPTTMASSTLLANLFAVSNLVVLCTRFVVRVEQQLLRRVLGHPLSALTHPYRRFLSVLLFAVTVIVSPSSAQLADSIEMEITALMGHDILIPCELVTTAAIECPKIHSIKWYQNDQRIYMYSDILGISNPEGRFQTNQPQQPSRAMYKANSTPPALYISPVQIADEGTYRCDVTYKTLTPGCPAGSTIKLRTLAKPQEPEIFLDPTEGEDYSVTSTLVGPYYEGNVATFICDAAGGKPPANVVWYKGLESLGGDFIDDEKDVDGTTTAKSRIRIKITEAELLARYECHVTHEALEQRLTAWIEINVHVPPKKLELMGNSTYFEDDEVTLTCMAKGARPAADVKWYNGTEVVTMHSPSTNKTLDPDGTSTSYSTLTFPASRFDDEEMFSCEASNQATEDGHAKSLQNSTTLVVYYAPIVQLLPDVDVLEINESSPFHLECSFEANPVDEETTVFWIRDTLRNAGTDKDGADDNDGEDLSEGSNINSNGLNGPQNGDEGAAEEGRFYYDIESIERHQDGVYSCEVRNIAGIGRSESINVSVLYPPEVRMIIFPTLAIEHKTNVTLTCEIEDANPAQVTSVRWYRNGAIFNETDETTLFLPVVDRTFHGNYSCQAKNRVGWSNISEAILLNICYTPGQAKLTHKPDEVVKGGEVTLFCEVDDPGNPPATDYVWKRGTFFLEVHSYNLTLENLHLNARDNYSCTPRNEAGLGIAGELSLEVYAPPAFRTELLPYHGALETATDISLTCQVECHPRCRIEWLRDGEVLRIPSIQRNGDGHVEDEDEANAGNGNPNNGHENETTNKNDGGDDIEGDNGGEDGGDWNDRYSVKISYLDFDLATNHFPSVISTLRWNMSAWPNGRLDRVEDSAKYTCRSSPNEVGPGVSYTTAFNVEYPPENISLSSYKVNVKEGENISSPVTCLASGHPEVQYVWTYDGEPVSSTNELKLGFPMSRDHSGLYYCTATNAHGNASTNVFLDVLYEPECQLDATMEDIGTVLTCTVAANPKIVEFEWLLDNETIQENIRSDGLTSQLTQVHTGGRYICVVNNSIGQSEACILELQGADGAMYIAGFGDYRIIIIVIIVVAIIIIAIIIAVIIILVLKRRSAVGKLGKPRRSDQPTGPVNEGDRAFYENLPFHGLQPAPNKPFKPALPDLEYADVEFPPQDQQVDGTPQRPPRTGKPTTNNSHS